MSNDISLGEIETLLRQRRDELRSRLNSIEADVVRSHSPDFAEQAQERENDEVMDEIGNETRLALKKIEAALERIADGEYGICTSCGAAIAPGRLQILPETIHCVNCAD